MSRGLQFDFTQGSIPRHLITFALPMLASNLLQLSQNVIDTIWVGRFVGTHALGVVATSFPLIFALLSLVIGMTIATSTLVAQYSGAGNQPMVRRTVANSLMLLTLGGLAVSAAGVIFRYPLLRLISTPPEMLDGAASYLGIFMGGIPVVFLYYAVEAIMRGLGNSRTPLRFMAVATVTNIILDPLLIAGIGPFPRLGVAGAALATVLSQCLTSGLLVWWLLKHTDLVERSRSFWRFDREILHLLFRIGLPAGLQMVLISFSMVFVTAMINVFGPVVVAAFGAASRFDHLALLPAISIAGAVGALVGQNLGARNYDRVKGVVRWSAGLCSAITGSVALVAIFRPELLLRLFTTDADVLTAGGVYLLIVGASYVPTAVMMVLGGVMQGAGDTMPSLAITVITQWLLKVPLCWYLSASLGPSGIWIGIAASGAAGLLLNWTYYLTGRWRRTITAHRPASAPA